MNTNTIKPKRKISLVNLPFFTSAFLSTLAVFLFFALALTGKQLREPEVFLGIPDGYSPTAGWDNSQTGEISVCNGNWCWAWDQNNTEWAGGGNPSDISNSSWWIGPDSEVLAAPDGTLPWGSSGSLGDCVSKGETGTY